MPTRLEALERNYIASPLSAGSPAGGNRPIANRHGPACEPARRQRRKRCKCIGALDLCPIRRCRATATMGMLSLDIDWIWENAARHTHQTTDSGTSIMTQAGGAPMKKQRRHNVPVGHDSEMGQRGGGELPTTQRPALPISPPRPSALAMRNIKNSTAHVWRLHKIGAGQPTGTYPCSA